MGCCCSKDKEDQENPSERTRLINNNDINQKSRFVDVNSTQNNSNTNNSLNQNFLRNNLNNTLNGIDSSNMLNSNQNNYSNNSNNVNNNFSENNQMFEKILSEVIHVSAFEQRGNLNSDILSNPVQDMPFKIKGLLEPAKQHLTLPDGVPAPVTVLSAQPPFSNDISLINNIAHEAQMCINNFSLQVPENVAFDFNPVV